MGLCVFVSVTLTFFQLHLKYNSIKLTEFRVNKIYLGFFLLHVVMIEVFFSFRNTPNTQKSNVLDSYRKNRNVAFLSCSARNKIVLGLIPFIKNDKKKYYLYIIVYLQRKGLFKPV